MLGVLVCTKSSAYDQSPTRPTPNLPSNVFTHPPDDVILLASQSGVLFRQVVRETEFKPAIYGTSNRHIAY